MGKQKSNYESVLVKLADWVKQSAKQDVITMQRLVEQAKAYLRAIEDLSAEEIHTLENFLLRDFDAFTQRLKQEADNSIWWQNTKTEFWQLIAQMSDRNQLELYEMKEDLTHKGVYHTGELVALGELMCNQCGHVHEVTHVERILPCTECGHKTFSRTS